MEKAAHRECLDRVGQRDLNVSCSEFSYHFYFLNAHDFCVLLIIFLCYVVPGSGCYVIEACNIERYTTDVITCSYAFHISS